MDDKRVYIAYTNTNLTDGHGADVPIAVCKIEATAVRRAKQKYVQGTDGPVRAVPVLTHEGEDYIRLRSLYVERPTR